MGSLQERSIGELACHSCLFSGNQAQVNGFCLSFLVDLMNHPGCRLSSDGEKGRENREKGKLKGDHNQSNVFAQLHLSNQHINQLWNPNIDQNVKQEL